MLQPLLGRLVLAITLAVVLAAAPTPARADVHEVMVTNFEFVPSNLSIRAGDTVTFFWVHAFHSVTSRDGLFDSGIQFSGFRFSVTFPVAGTFRYYCRPHELLDMAGVVHVRKHPVPRSRPVSSSPIPP